MRAFALLIVIASGLAASAAEKWQASELIGYSFTLDDKSYRLHLHFSDDGFGRSEMTSGPDSMVATDFSWKIDASGYLITKFGSFQMVFKKLKVVGDRYKLEQDGHEQEYIRQPWQAYQNEHAKKKD